jgi:hypothetical protein
MQVLGYGGWPLVTVGDRWEPLLGHVGGTAREDEAGPNLAAMAPIRSMLTYGHGGQSGCDRGCRRPKTK